MSIFNEIINDTIGIADKASNKSIPLQSNLRERLLKKQLDRLADTEVAAKVMLKDRPRGLSPVEERLNAQFLQSVRDAQSRLRGQVELLKRRKVAERELEREPLAPSSSVYRQSMLATIAGTLERERRDNAKLSRGAFRRVQAKAAARRRFNEATKYYKGADRAKSRYVYTDNIFSGVYRDTVEPTPCVEVQSARRQAMFARGLLGRGYDTPKVRRC